ncbi:MAG: MFS transporter [Hyphomicrobiales bacterium]
MSPTQKKQISSALVMVIIAGCMIGIITNGVRSTFGLFTAPISDAFGWGREIFGFAMALQNLVWGIVQPIAGGLADRFGTARVLSVGTLLYMIGVILMPFSETPFTQYLTGGLLTGAGIATASFAIVMAAFGRRVPEEARSWAFGVAMAAGSLGQFLFAPLGQYFINSYGWQNALIMLAAVLILIIPLTIPLRGSAYTQQGDVDEVVLPFATALTKAFGHGSYLYLVLGFFVCGFHVAFIAIHLPPYLADRGMSPDIGAWSLALIGFFNIIGSYTSGVFGGKYPKHWLLSGIYFGRGLAILFILFAPLTAFNVMVFSAVIGLLWLSTIPLTAGLVTVMFGTRYMGLLFGCVFLSHQIGSFLGVWLGGRIYDVTGSYDAMWWAGIGFAVFAGLVHLPIRENKAPAFSAA